VDVLLGEGDCIYIDKVGMIVRGQWQLAFWLGAALAAAIAEAERYHKDCNLNSTTSPRRAHRLWKSIW
jgi:hypothetical protein